MTEVPDNAENITGPNPEPGAPGPGEGPRRQADRLGSGYVAQLQPLPVWPEVLTRLTRGDSALSVATWLVTEQGFACPSVRALAGALTAYRRSLPQTVLPAPVHVLPGFTPQEVAPHGQRDAVLRNLLWAIKQQMARIRHSRKTEKSFPLGARQVSEDIEGLRRLLETWANLLMRFGLVEEAPQQFNVASLGIYADVATLGPDARARILDVAREMVRRARGARGRPGDGDGDGDRSDGGA